MAPVTVECYRCGQPQTDASRALDSWLASTETDHSFLPMMRCRIAGQANGECEDIYYIAIEDGKVLARLWNGWGRHENAVGNWGNFMTVEAARGKGIGRLLLDTWYEDLQQYGQLPLGLFCSAGAGLIDLYGRYGFTRAIPGRGMLYKPLGNSPTDFRELCEGYYCTAKQLTVRPATVQWRHEIDCLLKFSLSAHGEAFGLPGCKSLEEAIVWPHIGQASLVFTKKNRPVGWGFTGRDGKTHWQLHPVYRSQFEG